MWHKLGGQVMAGARITGRARSTGRTMLALAVAGAVLLPMVVPALAQSQSRQSSELEFTTEVPDSSSGDTLAIDVRDPEDPAGKPPAIETIVQRFHPGTVIDTSVPPRCEASDAQLMTQGPTGCPPETRVGGGELLVDTGAAVGPLPRIVENRVIYFNADEELILFTESTNTGGPPIRTVTRVEVVGRTMTSMVAPVPAIDPEDPFLAIKRVRTRLNEVSTGRGIERRSFITTPSSCPASGEWTNSVTFTYRDGNRQTAESSSPCVGGAGRPPTDEPPSQSDGRSQQRATGRDFPQGGVEAGAERPGASPPDKRPHLGAGVGLVALAGAGFLCLSRRLR